MIEVSDDDLDTNMEGSQFAEMVAAIKEGLKPEFRDIKKEIPKAIQITKKCGCTGLILIRRI